MRGDAEDEKEMREGDVRVQFGSIITVFEEQAWVPGALRAKRGAALQFPHLN